MTEKIEFLIIFKMDVKKYIMGAGTFLSTLALYTGLTHAEDSLNMLSLKSIDEVIADTFRPKVVAVKSDISYPAMFSLESGGFEHSEDDAPIDDGGNNLLDIVRNFDTSDSSNLISDLLWYSGSDFHSEWKENFDELKSLYLDYIDKLLQAPIKSQGATFKQDIVRLYSTLAELSPDNLGKTRMNIRIVNFLEDNYYPESFDDNYGLGKAFTNMSLYHPGDMSREGCKIEAINYFTKAREGNLLLAVADFYNELAIAYNADEKLPDKLLSQMDALEKHNKILCYDETDLFYNLDEQIRKLVDLPERIKDELLSGRYEPQEGGLGLKELYLMDDPD